MGQVLPKGEAAFPFGASWGNCITAVLLGVMYLFLACTCHTSAAVEALHMDIVSMSVLGSIQKELLLKVLWTKLSWRS